MRVPAPTRLPKQKAGAVALEDTPRLARRFYAVVAVSMLVGLLLNLVGFNAVTMLFWSAVVNGVLASPF